MRRTLPAALLLACALTATACSSAEPAPASTGTVTGTASASTSTSADATPAPAGAELPQACRDALDVASAVIAQSNTLIQQFARAVNGDAEAIAALSDPASSQQSAQQLSNDQAAYTRLAAECTGE